MADFGGHESKHHGRTGPNYKAMKRIIFVVFGCLVALALLWTLTYDQRYMSVSSIVSIVQPLERWNEWLPTSSDNFVSDVSTKGYLTREEALKYPLLTNLHNVVSMERSLVKILSQNHSFHVGDKITLSITLIEENGRRRERGGDKLHVRIFNTTYGAYAPGYVIDHNNGTFTAEVPALWPGVSIISFLLIYPREDIRVMYATMQQKFSTRPIIGRYESGENNETVLCQPAKEYFLSSEELCNFTQKNGGMSWYCGKPKNNGLQCNDLASLRSLLPEFILQTDAERTMFQRHSGTERNLTVTIQGKLLSRDELSDCSLVPKAETWMKHIPSGFFFRDRWHPTFCRLPNESLWNECMIGKHFTFIGDSTIRHWYEYMRDYLNCTQVTEAWTMSAWHKQAMCHNRYVNFTASFILHGRPFFPGDYWRTVNYGISPTAYLDGVREEKVAIVIHMFIHLSHYRFEIFQDRMNTISNGVRRLLSRKNNAIVLFKGPHTFSTILAYKYYLYRAIITETFKDLHDRVVFMEQGDMTIAKNSKDYHPGIDIKREAIRQLIGYIC